MDIKQERKFINKLKYMSNKAIGDLRKELGRKLFRINERVSFDIKYNGGFNSFSKTNEDKEMIQGKLSLIERFQNKTYYECFTGPKMNTSPRTLNHL